MIVIVIVKLDVRDAWSSCWRQVGMVPGVGRQELHNQGPCITHDAEKHKSKNWHEMPAETTFIQSEDVV